MKVARNPSATEGITLERLISPIKEREKVLF